MGTPGNWRACVAYIDRVDRGHFASGDALGEVAGQGPGHPGGDRRSDERLDLSQLSDDQVAHLEALYADTDSDEAEG